MAKWGEGDPRWVVESREDGHNVNGWHWQEKNRLPWAQQRLDELLLNLKIEPTSSEMGTVVITKVKDVSGEASITTRKGNKKFAMVDLKFTLSWEADPPSGNKVNGSIQVEEFMSTMEMEDICFSTTVEGSGEEKEKHKAQANLLKPQILKQLEQFLQDMSDTQ